MRRIRIYLDEDSMRGALADGLRANDFDVVTPLEEQRTGYSDASQLEFAAATGRAIYTSNQADYARLHWLWVEQQRTHAGIIVLSEQAIPVGKQIAALIALSAATDLGRLDNELVYLGPWLRRLP